MSYQNLFISRRQYARISGGFSPPGRKTGAGRKRAPPPKKRDVSYGQCQLLQQQQNTSMHATTMSHVQLSSNIRQRQLFICFLREFFGCFPHPFTYYAPLPDCVLPMGEPPVIQPSVILLGSRFSHSSLPAIFFLPALLRGIFQPAFPQGSPPALPRSRTRRSRPGARALPRISFPSAI